MHSVENEIICPSFTMPMERKDATSTRVTVKIMYEKQITRK